MEERFTSKNGQEGVDAFEAFIKTLMPECDSLKSKILRELSDYKEEASHHKRQADLYRNKIQARDVINALLPALSDIKNDVADADDLESLKELISVRFTQLFGELYMAGIILKEHKRNADFSDSEALKAVCKMTSDPSLNHKIARSQKMGCVIRGEEDDPILECVEIYIYDEKAGFANDTAVKDQVVNTPNKQETSKMFERQPLRFYSMVDESSIVFEKHLMLINYLNDYSFPIIMPNTILKFDEQYEVDISKVEASERTVVCISDLKSGSLLKKVTNEFNVSPYTRLRYAIRKVGNQKAKIELKFVYKSGNCTNPVVCLI
ncbi:MAG: hypothetical protein E7617_07275 [Ruminococcaceae bacterium]|nr:hypothetical protein [Oscillospiraceae bacterium]